MKQPRRLWQHGDMKDAQPGDNTGNLWDEQEIASRTGRHGRREIRRGARKQQRRRGRR